jgi:hypothetical protein
VSAVVFTEKMTLREARDGLRALVEEGHRCPCCTQLAKVYRRPMTAVAAAALIALYRTAGTGYGHMPTIAKQSLPGVAHQGGYITLGHYWGLIEEEFARREDGGRVGWWAVTPAGETWIIGRRTIPKYARIYDGRCLGHAGPPVDIAGCLGAKFDYNELMGRTPVLAA